jgi:hypothetical protein
MNHATVQRDSPAWLFFVWASFGLSTFMMSVGIWYMPVDLWIKGFLAMGLAFTVGSSFTLAKTVRDNYEAQKMVSRAADAKTEQLLAEYELRKSN